MKRVNIFGILMFLAVAFVMVVEMLKLIHWLITGEKTPVNLR